MRFHLSFEWQLNNLNALFEKIVGTSRRTVMVYSDVVESSVVGSGKFPLLREVQLLRTVKEKAPWNPDTINGSKCEEIKKKGWKWRLPHPVDP